MARLEFLENDIGIIERGDSYFLEMKFRENKTSVDPTNVVTEITYPCASGTTDGLSMATTATTGLWEGAWDVPSSATYGEYRVKVTATYDGKNFVYETFFYVLPWNINQHIRSISGIKQSNDISEKDLAIIAWNAYLEAREGVFRRVIGEALWTNAYHCINGNNTEFFTRQPYVVTDHLICGESAIDGMYYDVNQDRQTLTVTVDNGTKGQLTVKKTDGSSALTCDDVCKPVINYRVKSKSFSEHMFKKAVVYLASHEVILRFNELDKATLADLNSSKPIILANPDRMLKNYKKVMHKIRKVKVGGV